MLNLKNYLLITIILSILSGQRVLGYESVHNKSLGKMEMLEAIDKHIKNSISKDIAFLKREVQKLKKKKNYEESSSSGRSSRYDKKSLEKSSENSEEIRRIGRELDRLVIRVNSLSDSLKSISTNIEKINAEVVKYREE